MASGPVPPLDIAALGRHAVYVTRQSLFNFMVSREATQAMADDLFEVVASGAVRVQISRRFVRDEIRAAHDALESHSSTGSMILSPR